MNEINYTKKELEIIRHIRNEIMHSNRFPSIRKLMNLMDYKSPRSISLIFEDLINKGTLERRNNGRYNFIKGWEEDLSRVNTIDVPLIGRVACGMPMLAEENFEAMIPVSSKLAKSPDKYFILQAQGDSMNNAGINDGDLVLVRQQQIANNGEIVVALIDDKATIKEFYRNGNTIVLKPNSTNKKHMPIILTEDFIIQGLVIETIPSIY